MLLMGIVVGETLNTPLGSVRATVTSPVRKRPVTSIVLLIDDDSVAPKFSASGLTKTVGTRGCATPVMGTVTASAPSLVRVSVAWLLPAAVGA